MIIYYIPDADEMMRKASFYSWMFFVIGVSCIVSSGTAQARRGPDSASRGGRLLCWPCVA